MVFQIEDICTAYNSQKNFSVSNSYENINFLNNSKYTPGLIGLMNKLWENLLEILYWISNLNSINYTLKIPIVWNY